MQSGGRDEILQMDKTLEQLESFGSWKIWHF